ncbi:MAG: VWA domain-containing protein [Coriobacteriales bacterium]|nr:VWA domain-containing protein [Coriobacteriales bacterium]
MKKNLTELVFVVDNSGSMHGLENDTVGGLNATLEKNRALPGEALVSLVLFNNVSRVVLDRKPLAEVRPLTEDDYRVGGCTALLDAVGDAVRYHSKVQQILPEEHRAEHVMFVIITDGMENASTHRSYPEVKAMIEERRTQGWEFLFLGANIDAAAEAGRLGISEDRASRYVNDTVGNVAVYESVAQASCETRTMGAPSKSWKQRVAADFAARGRNRKR